jgi:Tfp pilus assembly protein PilX
VHDLYYSVSNKNAVSLQSPKSRSNSSKRRREDRHRRVRSGDEEGKAERGGMPSARGQSVASLMGSYENNPISVDNGGLVSYRRTSRSMGRLQKDQ